MAAVIKVLLVDDHAVVREGYRRLLERTANITVVGDAANATQACQSALALVPDVIVMDIALPGVSGIEALRRILAHQPKLRALMFSMHDDAVFAARALQAGARGYVSKASAPDVLVDAIYAVARGESYLSPDVANIIEQHASTLAQSAVRALTPREFEILGLLVQGDTVKCIADKLALSEKTVANLQSAIREKLGAKNGVQLTHIAARLGLSP